MNNCDYGINEGSFLTQAGFRSNVAYIECPYISHRIEVHDALDLQVLDGAQVYWREIRRYTTTKKGSSKQETVLVAAILGIKHCKYIFGGINIIATLEMQETNGQARLIARPINKKLPHFEIIDYLGRPITEERALLDFPNFS